MQNITAAVHAAYLAAENLGSTGLEAIDTYATGILLAVATGDETSARRDVANLLHDLHAHARRATWLSDAARYDFAANHAAARAALDN